MTSPRICLTATVLSALVLSAGLLGCAGGSEEAATPSATTTRTPSPSATPTATPTPTAVTFTTCDELAADEFLAMVASNGWQGWDTSAREVGVRPFADFPAGAPAVQLNCRYGVGPDVGTDNIVDLSWALIDPADAASAQSALEAQGYERIEAPEGVYLAMRGDEAAWTDDEGFAQAYLFTATDVRWTAIRDQLAYIRPAA